MKKFIIFGVVLVASLAVLFGGCDTPTTTPETPAITQQSDAPSQTFGKKGRVMTPQCCSGAITGRIWDDLNCNGIQDAGEPGVPSVQVSLSDANNNVIYQFQTNFDGTYGFGACEGTYIVSVVPPAGYSLAPANASGSTPENDSNENPSIKTLACEIDSTFDFGLCKTPPPSQCAYSPGYWKTHWREWPVSSITIGGRTYTRAMAIYFMALSGSDKRLTMFRALVSAKLNLLRGTDPNCIAGTVEAADAWMTQYAGNGLSRPPVVYGWSAAWRVGEPLYTQLDLYNNGGLCAPHCEDKSCDGH